mmetsp:Transcript_35921/g.57878  ORF Transcript_35921/g.57878 Transcript_35921/m.57878 type:complete len:171 (+) Transcript_35921:120-632(+)
MEELTEAHRRLGVRFSSSDDELKAAFRKAAFAMHPDRAKVSKHASSGGFRDVQQALNIIVSYRQNAQIARRLAAEGTSPTHAASYRAAAQQSRQSTAGGASSSTRLYRPKIAATLIGSALLMSVGTYLGMCKYRFSKAVLQKRMSLWSAQQNLKVPVPESPTENVIPNQQ